MGMNVENSSGETDFFQGIPNCVESLLLVT
jgi:hypothetical protein